MIKNKRILVTGGAGSIGSELVRQLAPKNKVYIFDNNETGMFDLLEELKQKGYDVQGRVGDIRDLQTVREVFNQFSPGMVFHAAALKHVTPGEWNPDEYIKTNSFGTWNVIQCCDKAELIYISTDKVIHSNSIMGITKRLGEVMVKNAGGVCVRFGNVLGSRGSVIPLWQAQIDRGEPLKITDERMERYFMTIPDACELVIEAAETAHAGEIMILDMGKPVKIIDVARKIIEDIKYDKGIEVIGIRPGETLGERLMTTEEELRAIKRGKFYVI